MTNSIKTLLAPFFQSKQHDWKIKLLNEWPTIIGPLAQHVTVVKVGEDTIILGVYDSCWLQELYLLSADILKTINQSLDHARIKQVRFKQIGKKIKKQQEKMEIIEHEPSISLTPPEKVALTHIKNENLRTAMHAFLVRCRREKIK